MSLTSSVFSSAATAFHLSIIQSKSLKMAKEKSGYRPSCQIQPFSFAMLAASQRAKIN
ncbi:hypothetical protein SD78_4439 [Bacillus badius]|nr:hypothetical protein SD78_4439 [Bacillus badius]